MNDSMRIAESNVLTGPDDPLNGPAKRFLQRVIERRLGVKPELPKIEPPHSICGVPQGESGVVPAGPGQTQAPGVPGATESVSCRPPVMFTKPPLGNGTAGPTRWDENDPDLYCDGKAEA